MNGTFNRFNEPERKAAISDFKLKLREALEKKL